MFFSLSQEAVMRFPQKGFVAINILLFTFTTLLNSFPEDFASFFSYCAMAAAICSLIYSIIISVQGQGSRDEKINQWLWLAAVCALIAAFYLWRPLWQIIQG
ncbi:hypothetical protein KKC32_00585 [Patescibacteria group bacterium]|nr:hypothetical protein [Patescibacteria group bacterium]